MFSLAILDEQWSIIWHQTSHEDTHTELQGRCTRSANSSWVGPKERRASRNGDSYSQKEEEERKDREARSRGTSRGGLFTAKDGLPLEVARYTKISMYASFVFGACAMMPRCSTEVKWLTSTSVYFLLNSECLDCAHIWGEFYHFASHLSTTSPKYNIQDSLCLEIYPLIYLNYQLLTLQTQYIFVQWHCHIKPEQLRLLLTWIQRSARTGATQSTASVSLLGLSLLTLQLLLLNTALLATNGHSVCPQTCCEPIK